MTSPTFAPPPAGTTSGTGGLPAVSPELLALNKELKTLTEQLEQLKKEARDTTVQALQRSTQHKVDLIRQRIQALAG